MTDSWFAAARTLVEQGADVICPSGLASIPVRVFAAEVARRLGVPVVDPALVSVRTAEMLVAAARPAREAVAALAWPKRRRVSHASWTPNFPPTQRVTATRAARPKISMMLSAASTG